MANDDSNPIGLEEALKQTIRSSDLTSVAIEVSELVFDSALQEGVLRDLPVLGAIMGFAKAGFAVRDAIFMRKTWRFLYALRDVPMNEREEFARKLDSDQAFGQRAATALIALIDRLDDELKVPLVVRAFLAHTRGQIDERELRRLLFAIETMLLSDLPLLKTMGYGNMDMSFRCELPAVQSFVAAGLYHVKSGFGVGGVWPTETMALMAKYVLKDK